MGEVIQNNRLAVAGTTLRFVDIFRRENIGFKAVGPGFDYSIAVNLETLENAPLAATLTAMASVGARLGGSFSDADHLAHRARMLLIEVYDKVDPLVIATHNLLGIYAEGTGTGACNDLAPTAHSVSLFQVTTRRL